MTNRAMDKLYKATRVGVRKSKKFATINMADGTKFRRRNANQYYKDGVPGGKSYSETRKNHTDRYTPMGRVIAEDGANIGNNDDYGFAKRGANVQTLRGKRLDKKLLASAPGKRTSKKFSKILKVDGTSFRRKNANQYYEDGVPGGKSYSENRVNHTDKRFAGLKMAEYGANIEDMGCCYSIGGL